MLLRDEIVSRLQIKTLGIVQGVGYRPFVYRLASRLELRGWVKNIPDGAVLEIEGNEASLQEFLRRFRGELPSRVHIAREEIRAVEKIGAPGFEIRQSEAKDSRPWPMPDLATCEACLTELFDPASRRFRYPFITCAECGPRYTLVESLPFDRRATSLRDFKMCDECEREYSSPFDRRFHAETISCPSCGPRLSRPLSSIIYQLVEGKIIAVKGIGGYHLMCDARDEKVVAELRRRKDREAKPFACLYPSLNELERDCEVSEKQAELLRSPEAPIVLLRKKKQFHLAGNLSPRNAWLGVMLPSNPIHHLLMKEFGHSLVCTSGNLSDEPLVSDEKEAHRRLGNIADDFLSHDRKIVHSIDDSVVRVAAGRPLVLRAGRGYAPMSWEVKESAGKTIALGGHQKNTIAVKWDSRWRLSPHIGDLSGVEGYQLFEKTISEMDPKSERVVTDAHPDYRSTIHAEKMGIATTKVFHHAAHAFSCLFDNNVKPPACAVTWDGSGYGADGSIWGGEFLRLTAKGIERVASFKEFSLPGGESGARRPGMIARSLLGEESIGPLTSSVGRLFDGVAFLLGFSETASFEGEAAIFVESLAEESSSIRRYSFELYEDGEILRVDWRGFMRELNSDVSSGLPRAEIARKFHVTLSEIIVSVAQRVGERVVALTGGCFQNKILSELTIKALWREGFHVIWHRGLPPNDGGISLGQLVADEFMTTGKFPCV